MKNFTITYTINGCAQKLNVKFKQSSIACFYIYKNNIWIGSLRKNCESEYTLISYSKFLMSRADVNAIGEQINLQVISNQLNPVAGLVMRAA